MDKPAFFVEKGGKGNPGIYLQLAYKMTEKTNMGDGFIDYIKAYFTTEDLDAVRPTITKISDMRENLRKTLVSGPTDLMGFLNACSQYIQILLDLSDRFPFGKNKSGGILGFGRSVKSVEIIFTWYDSLRYHNGLSAKSTMHNVHFELFSVLFNMAVTYSKMALSERSLGNDRLKLACLYYKEAAGILNYIASHPTELEVILKARKGTYDLMELNPRFLPYFSALMNAQAQQCFFEKANLTGVSAMLKAKLAMGVAELYKQAVQTCKTSILQNVIREQGFCWERFVVNGHFLHAALAHKLAASHVIASDAYGLELYHLGKASTYASKAGNYLMPVIGNSQAAYSSFQHAIQLKLATATKENETIYFQVIPKEKEVQTLTPQISVKATVHTQSSLLASSSSASLSDEAKQVVEAFAVLIPAPVRRAENTFRAKMSAQVRAVTQSVTEADDASKAALFLLSLPAALEAQQGEAGLPDELWSQIEKVQMKGGLNHLNELAAQVLSAEKDVTEQYQKAKDKIDDEKLEDNVMRTKFQHRWNRRTSEELGAEFSKDLQTIAGYLTRAKQSNDKVMGELNEGSKGMLALMEDRQSLETSHPHLNTQHDPQASAGDGAEVKTRMEVGGDKDTNHDNNHNNTNDREKPRKSTTPLAPEAQKLAALLDGLSKHLMTRQTLLQNYTDKAGSMQSNIQSHLLKELNKKDPGYIVEQELKSFAGEEAGIEAMIRQQKEELMPMITAQHGLFMQEQKHSEGVTARQNTLQAINVTVTTMNRLQSNLNEGLSFYADLTKQHIQPLGQRIDDFVLAREMEKKLLVNQLSASTAPIVSSLPPNANAAAANPAAVNPNAHYSQPAAAMYQFNPNASAPGAAPPAAAHAGIGVPNANPNPSIPVAQPMYPAQAHTQAPYFGAPPPQQQQAFGYPPARLQAQTQPHAHAHAHAHPSPQTQPPAQGHFVQQPSATHLASAPAAAGWVCGSCTFINPANYLVCGVCGTQRPH